MAASVVSLPLRPSITLPLRVGVIGLGRAWAHRYAGALHGLSHHFKIVGVCDPIIARAQQEAQRLRCLAAVGPSQLLATGPQALLLFPGPWYGLWPVRLAARQGVPVFSAVPVESALDIEGTVADVSAAQASVAMALPYRQLPAARRLRRLVHDELGPIRAVFLERDQRGRLRDRPTTPLLGLEGSALLHWGLEFVEGRPYQTTVAEVPTAGLTTVVFHNGAGQALQIQRRVGPGLRGRTRLTVVGRRGWVTAEAPRRLHGQIGRRSFEEEISAADRAAPSLLERFAQCLVEEWPVGPTLADAAATLPWLRLAEAQRTQSAPVAGSSQARDRV